MSKGFKITLGVIAIIFILVATHQISSSVLLFPFAIPAILIYKIWGSPQNGYAVFALLPYFIGAIFLAIILPILILIWLWISKKLKGNKKNR